MEDYAVLILVWIVGIPFALGVTLRGRWPRMKDEWRDHYGQGLKGLLWPLALAIIFAKLILQVCWFALSSIIKVIFFIGSWFRWLMASPKD